MTNKEPSTKNEALSSKRSCKRYLFEMRHLLERSEALVDFVMSQPAHALGAKLLDVERRHHRAENHRASHSRFIQFFLACEITHKTARKRVAGASRIEDRLEGERWNREIVLARE